MKAIWRTTVVILAALASNVVVHPAAAGEKIEFSPPAQPRVLKPLTEQDLRGRTFNFQKSELSAPSEASVNSMLPPPQAMTERVRAIESLVERTGAVGGLFDDTSVLLDNGLMLPGNGGTEIGIDDLFRSSGRRVPGNPILNPDNEGIMASERERAAREEEFLRMRRAAMTQSNENQNRPDRLETRFLPALDFSSQRNERVVRDALGRAPQPGFLDRTPSANGASTGFGGRDAFEKRERQMEDFRRLLMGTTAPSETPSDVAGGSLIGAPGVPTTLTPGATRSGSILDGPAGVSVSDPLAASRSIEALSQPTPSLDLNVGARGSSPLARPEPVVPTPTPMELFRQKHDTRIPARLF